MRYVEKSELRNTTTVRAHFADNFRGKTTIKAMETVQRFSRISEAKDARMLNSR